MLAVLRSGRLSLGPLLAEFEQAFADRLGAPFASAVSSGTAGLHLALRAVGVSDGDEVLTSPFSFVASANVAVYERARPVFADIDPVTLNLSVDAAAAAVAERTARCFRCTSLDIRRISGIRAVGAADRRRRVRGAGRGPRRRGRGRRPRTSGRVRLLRQQAADDGEGGIVAVADASLKERIDSERNQGRAPDVESLDHDRLGYNYRLSDIACALGLAQLERLDDMLAARARVAACYREALSDVEGLQLPCPDAEGNRRGWFVFVVQLPRGLDRDSVVRALDSRGIPSKPYFPAVHLMTYYREQFGHREGEFPVCEDVASRSIALPFFPQMSEGQVEQVVAALLAVLQGESS